MNDRIIRIIIRAIREFYKRVDGIVTQQLQKTEFSVSCRRGCTSCCMDPVVTGAADGFLVAHQILSKPGWEDWVKRLVEASRLYCRDTFDRTQYFKERHVCPFLDIEARDCTIYENRPIACRLLYSIDPPDHCSPDHQEGTIRHLNFLHLETMALQFNDEVLQARFISPFPLMVVFVMMRIANPASEKVIRGMLDGLPDPIQWTKKYVVEGATGSHDYTVEQMEQALALANQIRGKH